MAENYAKYIAIVEEQEKLLRFDRFTNQDALDLGLRLTRKSADYGENVAVRIDLENITVFSYFMDGKGLKEAWWMQKKLNGCLKTGKSSFLNYLEIDAPGKRDEHPWSNREGDFALRGGCFPLRKKDGELFGFVCVSGLAQEHDHQLLAEALGETLGIAVPDVLDGGLFQKA